VLIGSGKRRGDQASLALDEVPRREAARERGQHLLALGEAGGAATDLLDRLARGGRGGQVLQDIALVEGVGALGEAVRAGGGVPERALVEPRVGRSAPESLAGGSEELLKLPRAHAELGGSRPDLLAPAVGVDAVALAIARRDRGLLRGGLAVETDA